MRFLVKVRVNPAALKEFGEQLQKGVLDRSCIRGETYCLKADPAVGYSIWEAPSHEDFERSFGPWRKYYQAADADEVISPNEAMALLNRKS